MLYFCLYPSLEYTKYLIFHLYHKFFLLLLSYTLLCYCSNQIIKWLTIVSTLLFLFHHHNLNRRTWHHRSLMEARSDQVRWQIGPGWLTYLCKSQHKNVQGVIPPTQSFATSTTIVSRSPATSARPVEGIGQEAEP